jgi:hypothetical protein
VSDSRGSDLPALTVGAATPNRPLMTSGRVSAIHVVRTRDPVPGRPAHVSCEIEFDDGTGLIWLVFRGSREVPGVEIGTRLAISGTVIDQDDRLVVLEPLYHLEPPDPDEPQPD